MVGRSPGRYARRVSQTLEIREVSRHFRQAVVDALRLHGLPNAGGPLLDVTRLGEGGFGFVLRGYVHLPAHQGRERVKWLVVKAPVPYPSYPAGSPEQHAAVASSVQPFVVSDKDFVVMNEGLEREY